MTADVVTKKSEVPARPRKGIKMRASSSPSTEDTEAESEADANDTLTLNKELKEDDALMGERSAGEEDDEDDDDELFDSDEEAAATERKRLGRGIGTSDAAASASSASKTMTRSAKEKAMSALPRNREKRSRLSESEDSDDDEQYSDSDRAASSSRRERVTMMKYRESKDELDDDERSTQSQHREHRASAVPSSSSSWSSASSSHDLNGPAMLEQYLRVQPRRDQIEKWLNEPHFESLIVGTFLRISIGQNVYRMAEVIGVESRAVSYKLTSVAGITNKRLRMSLNIGPAGERAVKTSEISNKPIEQHEFDTFMSTASAASRNFTPLTVNV